MIKVTVKAKASKDARRIQTWHRFADSMEQAIESAKRIIDEEYYGEGVLISVKEKGE
jgi:hypothetical protein